MCPTKTPSEYDQEMPQSQTTDQPTAPSGRDIEHGVTTQCKATSSLSLSLCKMIAKPGQSVKPHTQYEQ